MDFSRPTASTPLSSSASVTQLLRTQGITGFVYQNGPGIASWYRTNNQQDFTNGASPPLAAVRFSLGLSNRTFVVLVPVFRLYAWLCT